MKSISNWITDSELKNLFTSEYWNNIEEEKNKPWWIADGDYEKCIRYLTESKLLDDYRFSEQFIIEGIQKFQDSSESRKIKILDLAAGIGWTSALISKLAQVNEVHAVEFSKHRLEELFEHSVKMFSGIPGKINRYLGSFYDLKFENGFVDIIFICQAFHHADKPFELLRECDRVLKKNGRIIMIGEHNITWSKILRKFISNIVKERKIETNFYKLFKPDPVLGDHYYRNSDYYFLFHSLGYNLKNLILPSGDMIYIADKK